MDALLLSGTRYRALANETDDNAAGEREGDIDWIRLKRLNPEIAAWLRVGGTSIDLPVAQPAKDRRRDWYLKHDAWGNPSELGCPYLDRRCSVNDRHILVYGHRINDSTLMFTEIANAYRQEVFGQIGNALWQTPERMETFTPLLALKLDKADDGIQRFDFESKEMLETWLMEMMGRASSLAGNAHQAASQAEQVLTLISCSSRRVGGRERTALVFASIDEPGECQ